MVFLLLCLTSAPEENPKAEAEGFVVSVHSAVCVRDPKDAGKADFGLTMTLILEARDSSGPRRAVMLPKIDVESKIVKTPWRTEAGRGYANPSFHDPRTKRREFHGQMATIQSQWKGDDKDMESIDSVSGEFAWIDSEVRSYAFTKDELVPGSNQKQQGVDVRLYCFDVDPLEKRIRTGLRFASPGGVGRTSYGRPIEPNADVETRTRASLEMLAAPSTPRFRLDFEDGSTATPQYNDGVLGGYPDGRAWATFSSKGGKPKTLHFSVRVPVGEVKRVPFRLENIRVVNQVAGYYINGVRQGSIGR